MFAPIRPTPTKPIRSLICSRSLLDSTLFVLKLWKEWIVLLLLSDACKRAMSGADDRLAGQRQNLLAIVFKGIRVRDSAATHGPRKERIAHHCHRAGEAGNY